MKKSETEALERAIAVVGNANTLAEILGISRQAINQWWRVPAERAIAVERATGGRVPRHELRPDLYPEEDERTAF